MRIFCACALQVLFPYLLEMDAYTEVRQPPPRYILQGVVVHLGRTISHGHYMAYIHEHGQWREFDDEEVAQVH